MSITVILSYSFHQFLKLKCHDFWHALTGLPPTVLGELGLKYLELFQTGLPIAALSSTIGAFRLEEREREVLLHQYLPWAIETSQKSCFLMNVYYEKEFDTPLEELRNRLNIKAAPRAHSE
jgi:ubiquinone biosynthesis protein COQ4